MKHKIITILILIIALIGANISIDSHREQVPEVGKVFPKVINNWVGKDFNAENNVYKLLNKDELLLRIYQNTKTGDKISLAIVLTQHRDQIHDPNLCYRSQGLIIDKEEEKYIPPNNIVNYVKCKKYGQKCDMIFWYTNFKKTYSDRAKFMLDVVFSKFFDRPVNGLALVVIIGPASKNNDTNPELVKFADDVNKTLSGIVNSN